MTKIDLKSSALSFQTDEAIKTLRANIQFSGYGVKTIALTSSHPNEGKSFVSFELARSLAEQGKKTLFLDCDIRKSVLQSRLGVTDDLPGLSDFLVGKAKVGDILIQTDMPKLNVIFAGSMAPNPAELLSDPLFGKLCDALKQSFDYLILDTAPLGTVIDAAIIAKHCDGSVIVIESGGTDRKEVQRVKRQLDAANVRVLGVVLNKVGKGDSYYGRYGKYGYSKYGYGYSKDGYYGRDVSDKSSRRKK